MLKSLNFNLYLFFLHFNFVYHTNKTLTIKTINSRISGDCGTPGRKTVHLQ